ncbi:MAG: hypothetical protein IKT82_06150 [Bacteroidaceae bacterium]|nr:hypothetical protein [Bacteroidaceae bacterium]
MKNRHILLSLIVTGAVLSTTPALATDEVETYERKIVVEKSTGTWCGYCPRGILGFRTMYEKYPDNFIGIAIHNDDMYSPTYIYYVWQRLDGYPDCELNRKHHIDPNEMSLENYYLFEIDKATARIQMTAQWENEQRTKAVIYTTTRFAHDRDEEFRIAYVVTENSVGPYLQANNYSGGTFDMGGFEKEDSRVYMLHDHVARSISTLNGESESVPSQPKARTDYQHEYVLTLPDNIQNKENIELIVLLINQSTGEIENADVKKFADIQAFGTTEISQISAKSSSAEVYYDLYGRRYSEKPKQSGVYIHRGNKIIIQ